ncbi:MAG: low affinity iron permease family protein [Patescibacteria group bacterium]
MSELFRHLSHKVSEIVGSPAAFLVAVILIATWGATGVLFDFSNTWQLVINTGTTILTFLIVFLIQNTQNRDAKAIHIKLDELLRAMGSARNSFVDVEELSDGELERIEAEFRDFSERARRASERRRNRTSIKNAKND